MSKRIEYIIDDIKEQYLEKDNNIPWIIGFSGGKDSTVVLTLVWRALLSIREELGDTALVRQVYVVNNDTLVENPIITDYIVEVFIIRKSKFPPNPERSVQFSGKRTKRSVQKKGYTQHL